MTPAAPAVAAPTPTPAVTPVVTPLEDAPVPLADAPDITDQDTLNDQPQQEIEDEEVPLTDLAAANGLLHHIQHACEVFTSAFLPLFYVGSNRKRRKKISELKREIDKKTERDED